MTKEFTYYQREKTSGLDPRLTVMGQIQFPANGVSDTSRIVSERLTEMFHRMVSPSRPQPIRMANAKVESKSIKEQLFDTQAAAKIMTSQVSMHLDEAWRRDLFNKLDDLLDVDAWHDDDTILNTASFATYLRFILFVRPKRQPSIGISNEGNMLAGWTSGKDRLSMELLPADSIRWVLVRYFDSERETAAAQISLGRLMEVLAPYQPEQWLFNGKQAD